MCFGGNHPSRIWVAIHWSTGDVFFLFWQFSESLGPQYECKLLVSDTHTGEGPRLQYIYQRWLHQIFTIRCTISTLFARFPMIQLAYCCSFTTNKQELHVWCTLLACPLIYFWWFLQLWITQDFLSQVVKYFRRGLMMIAVPYIHWCRTLWCLNNLIATKNR